MRTGKKRVLGSVALVAGITLTAGACGSNSGSAQASGSGASGASGASTGVSGATTGTSGTKTTSAFPAPNKKPITLLFGSSGPAETAAEKGAGKAFTQKTGIPVKVVAAANLTQELEQDFAGNQPPNLFYLSPSLFNEYAPKGVLESYGQKLPNKNDFFSSLASAFTYKGKLVCDPKDGGPLSLYINTKAWKAAGLTSADYPKTWSQLATDAKKLTKKGQVGLTMDPSESRMDAFFYQAGGSIFNSSHTKVTLDSPANVKALKFLKGMLKAGSFAFPSTLNEGGGTDALGAGKAAMVVTGNWLSGTMTADYPKVKYTGIQLPAGPGGKSTLTFTNCWGVPKNNDNLGGTIEFVKFLTSPAQELKFAKEFGPVPSLKTVKSQYLKEFPQNTAVIDGLGYGHPDISLAGSTQALTAFNSGLAELGSKSPSSILKSAQTNLQAVLNQDNG